MDRLGFGQLTHVFDLPFFSYFPSVFSELELFCKGGLNNVCHIGIKLIPVSCKDHLTEYLLKSPSFHPQKQISEMLYRRQT